MAEEVFQDINEETERRFASMEDRFRRTEQAVEDLQTQVSGLNAALERTLSDLLPKVESLLRGVASATVSGAATSSCQRTLSSHSQGEPLQIAHTSAQEEPKATTSMSEASSVPNLRWPCVTEAAAAGDAVALRRILANGGYANQYNTNGVPALHLAVAKGHLNAVEALLDGGACVNFVDPELRTALHIATAGGHVDVVERLLEAGSELEEEDPQGNTALMVAVNSKQWQIVRLLVKKGADSNKNIFMGKSAIMVAAAEGDLDTVVMMLRHRTPDDVCKVLSYARDVTVVQAFEEVLPGVLRQEGEEAMGRAAEMGRLQSMVALLDAGVDIDRKGNFVWSALMRASYCGRLECVEELVRRGANLDAVNTGGFTALHYAALLGKEAIVRVLLDAGADPTIKDRYSKTAWHCATRKSIKKMIKNYLTPSV